VTIFLFGAIMINGMIRLELEAGWKYLHAIRGRMHSLAAATGIAFIASIFVFIQGDLVLTLYPKIILAFAIPSAILFAALSLREYNRLKIAKLIVDNQILHVLPAVSACTDAGKDVSPLTGKMEIFVSGFGVLLDSKVIQFNLDRIRLQEVQINKTSMCLTYGTKLRTREICLMHGVADIEEIQRIAETFRYETGLIPIIGD
jgi:hypothetical protein